MCTPTYLTLSVFEAPQPEHTHNFQKPFKYLKSHFFDFANCSLHLLVLLLSSVYLPTFCLHLSLQRCSLTFHLNIHRFRSRQKQERDCFLNESVFVLILHAVCSAGAQTSPMPSSSHIISLHGGHCPLPSETETGRSLFLTALVDWLHPQPCTVKKKKKKTEFIFSVLAPSQPQPVSKNVFLLVWQTRCVSLCVNVYILLYMCGRTKWVLFCFVLRAGAFSVHVVLRVNGSLYDTCDTSLK